MIGKRTDGKLSNAIYQTMLLPIQRIKNSSLETGKWDWKISDKTEETSVRGRLKENRPFSKNELKPDLFVQNVIDNAYIMPFSTIPLSFCPPNKNPI